jgi:uncharacterized caspase-like protein
MERRIVGFHQDEEGHWVAELECGHQQHVRHDPPWQERPWVLDEATRNARIGTVLPCAPCERVKPAAYQDARLCGLCEEGADELVRRREDRS